MREPIFTNLSRKSTQSQIREPLPSRRSVIEEIEALEQIEVTPPKTDVGI